jgi:Calpain family cysteine protease
MKFLKTFFHLLIFATSFLAFTKIFALDNASAPKFADVINQHFSGWDKNGDGVLSKDEVFTAMGKPEIRDEEAAAITAIAHGIRNEKHHLPPITKQYLLSSTSEKVSDLGEQVGDEEENPKSGEAFPFQKNYKAAIRKIHATSRELFPQRLPSFEATHQGAIGDCPFVSTVGAMVYRNPAVVKNLFTQNADGSIIVRFGGGQHIKITHITDSDIALFSSAGTNGMWFTVLEKAYRRVLAAKEHPDKNIYEGFGSSETIQILDGYKVKSFPLEKIRTKAAQLSELRREMISALNENRLVKAETSEGKKTPGITPGHAYAILGYDKKADVCHVWNPHGNNFTPKGSDGLQNGYTTKRGEFDIPLKDLVQIFADVNIETRDKVR